MDNKSLWAFRRCFAKGGLSSVLNFNLNTRHKQKLYTFCSDNYPNIILQGVKRYLNVVTEGPPQSFFNQSRGNYTTFVKTAAKAVPYMPPQMNNHKEDIQVFTALGAIVDYDNLPAPENISPPDAPPIWPGASKGISPADGWGLQGTCPQKLPTVY
jgi:hypothetical protein